MDEIAEDGLLGRERVYEVPIPAAGACSEIVFVLMACLKVSVPNEVPATPTPSVLQFNAVQPTPKKVEFPDPSSNIALAVVTDQPLGLN